MTPLPELPRSPWQAGCLGALAVGGAGVAAGVLGAKILAPTANHGPMVGVLITRPAGAVLGFVAGVTIALVRRRRTRT